MHYKKLNYQYDHSKVIEEIYRNQNQFVEISASMAASEGRPFDIVSKELYDQVKFGSTESNDQTNVQRTIPSWYGFCFTYISGNNESLIGKNKFRLSKASWIWRPDINCPYIQKIARDLGYIKLQNVRAMMINPPGFGPVHRDVYPGLGYFKTHTSITLNIESGGQPLVAQFDSKFNELNDECYIFNDDCWHGVGVVTSRRTQLRFNGTVNLDSLKKYF